VARGVDPSKAKKLQKANQTIKHDSFQGVALAWFDHKEPSWGDSHIKRTKGYFKNDIYPCLGHLHINEITTSDVVGLMQKIEARGAGDAARRVKQYILQVYKYAKTLGLASHNPAADIDNSIVLRPRVKKHYATITDPVAIGQLMRDIDQYKGSYIVRFALQLSPLVMLRPTELRAGEWSEIDLDAGLWTIPVARMKVKKHIKEANQSTHIVPLPRQAIAILKELQPYSVKFKYLFPSARGASRPLSDNGVRVALRTMGYDNDAITPHGFRGMASTLLNQLGWNPDAIERQLAHQDTNRIRAAYNHAQYLEERREMLQAWADYLDTLKEGGQVVPFERRRS